MVNYSMAATFSSSASAFLWMATAAHMVAIATSYSSVTEAPDSSTTDDSFNNTNTYNNNSSNSNSTNSTGSNDDSTNDDNDDGNQAYEFVAFLAWYLFLVLCCVVPACCAYRRRRVLEAQLTQQQANIARMQQNNNMFLWETMPETNLYNEAVRTQWLKETLKDTTMVVTPDNLIENADTDIEGDNSNQESNAVADVENVYLDGSFNFEESRQQLRLPNERLVGSMCAICLCQYEPDEAVTWSAGGRCQHVFHTECIISWLCKKQHCPVCRQDFCEIVERAADRPEVFGTVPVSSVFSVDSSGRVFAYSYHDGSPTSRMATPGSATRSGIAHLRGDTWGTSSAIPVIAGRNGGLIVQGNRLSEPPIRVHLPSLTNPRLAVAESMRQQRIDQYQQQQQHREESEEVASTDDIELAVRSSDVDECPEILNDTTEDAADTAPPSDSLAR
jgi:hypothetical protein